MFKKSLASIVTAAILVTGPGQISMTAAAQTMTRGPVSGISVTPTIGAGLNSPGLSSFNTPTLTPGALLSPSLLVAPSIAAPVPVAAAVVAAVQPQAVAAVPAAAVAKSFPKNSYAALRAMQLPAAAKADDAVAAKGTALNALFDNSVSKPAAALDVQGSASAIESGLGRSEVASAMSPAAIEGAAIEKGQAAGEAGLVSLVKRAWNAFLGMLGIGVKKMETPEVMAQRIIDQLNAQKPIYNQKVADASTLVEKLKLQVQSEEAKVKELETGITAILSDSDPNNDVMAGGMINQQKTLNASITATKEQITLAEGTLQHIKDERASFFSDREEMLAKIQAGLTKSKSAEIQKQIAELKGGFQIGDLKDNMDKFDAAVDDKVADAKGTVDSVDSNPDQILKKAKDSLKNQEVQDELAKRKAAIEQAKKDKGAAGGSVSSVWSWLNNGTPFGSYKSYAKNGQIVRVYGWSLSGRTVFQSVVLGLVAGPIVWALGMASLPWAIASMALAPFVVDLLKPTWIYTNQSANDDKGAAGGEVGAVSGTLFLGLSAYLLVGGGDFILKYAAASGVATQGLILIGLGMGMAPLLVALAVSEIGALLRKGDDKGQSGGLLLELGVGAGVIAILAAVSAPFRNLIARAWNAALGMLGLGVKKLETPEVMAQRIIDQLNAQKPVYNRKVQEASTLVEKLRLQIEKQEAQSADLDKSVTAILSDSDASNDVMAESLLNQKKTIDASTVMTKEQIVIAEKTLESIKEERVRFFSEREEMLAKIQAGLTKSKSAEIQKQIAELKGGFQVGDLKDNMDKFDAAVDDKVADAKGTVDSVDSNPDQILKKAKDSLKNQEVQDEIAKRKAAIEAAKKDKGAAGGDASQSKALGYFAKAIGIGFALISPWIASAAFALLGLVSIAMAPEQGRWFGRQLAVIGLGTLGIGFGATFLAAKFGLAVGAFGIGMSFLVPAGIALAAGVIAALRAHAKAGNAVADAASTPAGHSVLTPAPVSTPAAEPSAPSASSPKVSFSIKPLLNLVSRFWNALLGIFGMGVKKMETPEIMAQRLIDQLNDAKPVYNQKVAQASTLVEKLRQQIAGEQAKIAEFDKTITAILSDNDPSNDVQAAGLLNSQKTLEASVAASKEQLASSEKALENIKEERARFFSEREETLAKIQAGLTKVKSAEIQKQIAELKGGFQIGDLKDNMDRFDGAVNDKIADAKGATDSVESNPDQVLKKAKDSLRTQEINDELAKRKAAIEQAKKDKGAAGGKLGTMGTIGAIWLVIGLIANMHTLAVIGGIWLLIDLLTSSNNDKGSGGGLLLELGIGAGVLAILAAVSAPFRNLIARAWNAALGMLGMGVKKLETPEVMAQRIIDQLNAQKPVYNRKVQEASTLVEKLRLQIEKQEAQSADLDKSVTAILSDSDASNDVMAESLLNQKKTIDASTVMTKEQIGIAEKTLESIKEERVRFFSEREEMLAKIQAGLTKSKSAEIQKQIAELKGGFQVGDLKDNMDKFDAAVDDKVADAKGTVDSVDSNPDQILKKAKDSLKNQEVQDEIAKRKAAIEAAKKDKGQAGGDVSRRDLTMTEFGVINVVGIAAAIGIGFLTHSLVIGLLGTYVAAVPLLYAYVALRNAFGASINTPKIRFAPSFNWGGKKRSDKDDKGDAAGAVDEPLTSAQAVPVILSKTYSWMTLGLGITAAAAQAAIVTGAATTILASLPMMIGLAVLQLGLVIGLSLAIKKLSPGAALGGFLLYSGLNGLFLAPLVAMFTVGSVAASFLVTAGMFGGMAVVGHTTKANLNSVGSYGAMALMGVILASVANMFLHSTGLGAILTYATILIFVGLTAYDAQKIKEMAQKEGTLSKDDQSRIAVMGALTLYLDFINLFIQILKIMGKAKSKD